MPHIAELFGELWTQGVAFLDVGDMKIYICDIYKHNEQGSRLSQTGNVYGP